MFFIIVCHCHAQRSDFDHLNFQKADSLALAYTNEGLYNLPELSQKLTSNLATDVEKFRAIYMWVCTNISNDYTSYLKNKRKRERFQEDSLKLKFWNDQSRSQLIETLLTNKRTICTGYAYLVKKLANLANINCEIVHGYGRTSITNLDRLTAPNHSWNAVELNGKWYLCDPTWASGIPDPTTQKFRFQYNDGFFLANPKLFAINHFPDDTNWLLIEENSPSFDEFLEAPVVYGKAYKNLTLHNAPKKMHHTVQRHETVTFKYELTQMVLDKTIRFEIDNGYFNKKVQPKTTIAEDTSVTLEYQFEFAGFYDVHLFIGEDRISTYTFKVKG